MSIVTPSYNQGRFLEEAIRSVLLQGYPDLEYLIADGGSTDETLEVIRKYERWLAWWVSEPDRGQSHAINKGLLRSTGRFFNWHNADDVLVAGAVGTAARALLDHPEAGLVHGYSILIDRNSRVLGERNASAGARRLSWFVELAPCVANMKAGCQPGALMQRDLLLALGMIDERLHYVMDLDIFLRIALVRPQLYVNRPLVYYRSHAASKSAQANRRRAGERLLIAQKVFRRRRLPPEVRRVRKAAFAAAHGYARMCYADAGMPWSAWRHDVSRTAIASRADLRSWAALLREGLELALKLR